MLQGLGLENLAEAQSSRRTVELPGAVVGVLRAVRDAQRSDPIPTLPRWRDSVTLCRSTGLPLSRQRLVAGLRRAADEAGVYRTEPLRLHDLRHTFATGLLRAGVPVTLVSATLGHANPSITLKVYSHVIPSDAGLVARVAGKLIPTDL